jgi:hypothetical protein
LVDELTSILEEADSKVEQEKEEELTEEEFQEWMNKYINFRKESVKTTYEVYLIGILKVMCNDEF